MSNVVKSNPQISIINGAAKTTSLAVAEFFQKRHDNVVRAIRSLVEQIGNGWSVLNFEGVEYKDAKGEVRTMYNITRDGFTLLAMGFTGKSALQWKLAYIKAFNAMEAKLKGSSADTLSPAQKNALQKLIKEVAGDNHRAIAGLWSRFNNHFKINTYHALPPSQFVDACVYIAHMEKPKQQLALPDKSAENDLKKIIVDTAKTASEVIDALEEVIELKKELPEDVMKIFLLGVRIKASTLIMRKDNYSRQLAA